MNWYAYLWGLTVGLGLLSAAVIGSAVFLLFRATAHTIYEKVYWYRARKAERRRRS